MTDKNQNTSQSSISDPAKSLLKIVHGDVNNLHIPHKSIVSGKKIKNSVLRAFVKEFMDKGEISHEQMLNVILAFDETVEKELLTEDILEAIRRDPSILEDINTKK